MPAATARGSVTSLPKRAPYLRQVSRVELIDGVQLARKEVAAVAGVGSR